METGKQEPLRLQRRVRTRDKQPSRLLRGRTRFGRPGRGGSLSAGVHLGAIPEYPLWAFAMWNILLWANLGLTGFLLLWGIGHSASLPLGKFLGPVHTGVVDTLILQFVLHAAYSFCEFLERRQLRVAGRVTRVWRPGLYESFPFFFFPLVCAVQLELYFLLRPYVVRFFPVQ